MVVGTYINFLVDIDIKVLHVVSCHADFKQANNRAFQWFALNSVESVQKLQKDGVHKVMRGTQVPKLDPKLASTLESSKKEASGFGNALLNEIKKDLGMTSK